MTSGVASKAFPQSGQTTSTGSERMLEIPSSRRSEKAASSELESTVLFTFTSFLVALYSDGKVRGACTAILPGGRVAGYPVPERKEDEMIMRRSALLALLAAAAALVVAGLLVPGEAGAALGLAGDRKSVV